MAGTALPDAADRFLDQAEFFGGTELMQSPKFGPPPTPAEVEAARQESIDAFAEADRKHRAFLAVLARLQFHIEQDKQLILKENMREPRGRS